MGWPSFVSYYLDAVKMGATPATVPLVDGAYDLPGLADRIGPRTKIAYVCNPNNPTGSMVGRDALAAFVDAVPEDVLIVVDEAYSDYITDPDYPDAIVEHVGRRPNVAVLRTFSKIYGLAGLRVGYMVGPPEVVREVMKIRNAFDVSELAHVAALASLDDADELRRRREVNERGRIDLQATFEGLGMQPLPGVRQLPRGRRRRRSGAGRGAHARGSDRAAARPVRRPRVHPGDGRHARGERDPRRRPRPGAPAAVSRRPVDLPALVEGVAERAQAGRRPCDHARREPRPAGLRPRPRALPAHRLGGHRRLHRPAGGGEVEPARRARRPPARAGQADRRRLGRPLEPVLARARCWATASASPTTSSTRASSSAR